MDQEIINETIKINYFTMAIIKVLKNKNQK